MKIETTVNTGGETGILFENDDIIEDYNIDDESYICLFSETKRYNIVLDEESLCIAQLDIVRDDEGCPDFINEVILFEDETYLEDLHQEYDLQEESNKIRMVFEAPDLTIEITW